MKRKFVDNLYFVKMFKFGSKQQGYYKTGDGTLFSSNGRKTKLLEADAPEWYLFGRFYKMWGYLSTKGVMDMVYVPNMCFNHFLRDDFLLAGGRNARFGGLYRRRGGFSVSRSNHTNESVEQGR